MSKFWNVLGLLCMLATICLVILRLSSIIIYSWWITFMPLIGYVGLILVFIIIALIAAFLLNKY